MAVLSVVVAMVLLRCSAAVPQLYPFGAEVGDSLLPQTLDGGSGLISLNISSFPFFDELYSTLSVNNNGHISLEQSYSRFVPLPLPQSLRRLIAPFWADTDTRDSGNNTDRGFVWYRETSNADLLSRAQQEIQMAFVNQRSFNPASLFIATWDQVDYLRNFGAVISNRSNTFQCVMVTDGIQSFVLFLYEDIQWTSSDDQGGIDGLGGDSPALAGINAGDGIRSYTIPGSLTDDIINITETSNVGVPGLWIFRVDQEDIAVGGCSSEENTPLLFAPRSGSVLGGTAVQIGGPCFEQSHRIVCIFDSQEVEGVVVNEMMAVCITPPLTNHGRREFQLMVLAENGSLVYAANSFFNSLSIEDGPTLIVDYTEPLLLPKNQLNIQWSISRLTPLNNPESFKVDICLYEFDLEEGSWREMAVLKRNTSNDGRESVFIPGIAAGDRVIPVALQISSSLKQELPTANDNRSLAWGHVIFYSSTKRDNLLKPLCVNWFQNQPAGIGEALLDRLPSCAPTISRVRLKSVFSEDTGQRRRANQLFHPRAERCFRQTAFTEDNQGSGQQCCYDNNGNLITGDSMDAGSVDMIAPVGLQETWAHFQEDVLPLVFCCLGFECNTYHTGRPSDKGEDCPIIPPACVYGDPHIVTLDGLKYTFNGKGEFILIETEDNSFELQGRMVPANDLNGTEVQATVFSAIVGKELNSDTVQFQISSVRGIDFFVNGELIVFDELEEQEFKNVTVKNEGNDSLSASFSSGAQFEVRVENEIISVVLVSMPDVYQGMLSGLMGNFNGNTSDDLIPRFSTDQLPVNSSIEGVHSFGITWIIDNPADSLFTYRSGQNWTTFYDPDFLPVFATVFNDPELLTEAEELCGDDQFCLYDVAATRRTDIGLTTLMGNQEFEEIVELAMPIVCDPPCVNGACVSNNTCNCAPEFTGQLCTEPIICEPRCENGVCVANNTCNCTAGYEGPQCTIPIVMECDDNPCQSGGTCTQSASFIICECPDGFTGDLCEIPPDVLQVQVNDSLVGDPLITVPILVSQEDLRIFNVSQLSLCYEVHGAAGDYFNLISDQCTLVNGLYTSLNQSQFLNVITELGVRAVDDSGTCKNIQVNAEDCKIVIDGVLLNGSRYRSEGISVRRVGNRVRISVPNCNELPLVMWAICTTAGRFDPRTRLVSGEALDFHIMRGLNFGHSAAHGLIGQFWNRPIRVVPFTGLMRDGSVAPDNTFEIRITSRTRDDFVLRLLTGMLHDLVWDKSDGPCLYVGNQQAGPVYEVENPNDPVIEGVYKDYRVQGLFEESRYIFAQFNETQCV